MAQQVGVEQEVQSGDHPRDLPGLPVHDAGEDPRQARARVHLVVDLAGGDAPPLPVDRRPAPGRGAARPSWLRRAVTGIPRKASAAPASTRVVPDTGVEPRPARDGPVEHHRRPLASVGQPVPARASEDLLALLLQLALRTEVPVERHWPDAELAAQTGYHSCRRPATAGRRQGALPFPPAMLPRALRNRRSRYALGRSRALRVAECLGGLRRHRLRRCLLVTHCVGSPSDAKSTVPSGAGQVFYAPRRADLRPRSASRSGDGRRAQPDQPLGSPLNRNGAGVRGPHVGGRRPLCLNRGRLPVERGAGRG